MGTVRHLHLWRVSHEASPSPAAGGFQPERARPHQKGGVGRAEEPATSTGGNVCEPEDRLGRGNVETTAVSSAPARLSHVRRGGRVTTALWLRSRTSGLPFGLYRYLRCSLGQEKNRNQPSASKGWACGSPRSSVRFVCFCFSCSPGLCFY